MPLVKFYVILAYLVIVTFTLDDFDDEKCSHGKCTIPDPRLSFSVDIDDYISPPVNISKLYDEITKGCGYVIIPQVFSAEDIAHARSLIHYLLKTQGKKATHFQGYEKAKPDLQARVWNLLNKGRIWEKMVQHPLIIQIGSTILGDDFQLGSIATNTIFPGGSGQEPHIDYPYWDYYNKKHWPVPPKVKDIPFFMNMQVTVLLDDFTAENGATAVRPGSQLVSEYPSDTEDFYKNMVQTTGLAGDMIVFVGLLQHCAMPNKSLMSRTGVLLQYLPKYIRPMEDIKRGVSIDVLKRATPTLRNLLLLDYPYPSILDEADGTNSEGFASDFSWKNIN